MQSGVTGFDVAEEMRCSCVAWVEDKFGSVADCLYVFDGSGVGAYLAGVWVAVWDRPVDGLPASVAVGFGGPDLSD